MKEEILASIRKERDILIRAIQKENKRKKRLKELLNEPQVKEFLKLSGRTFNEDLSISTPEKSKIVGEIIEEYKEFELEPEKTNQIYLCRGKNYLARLNNGLYQRDFIGNSDSVRCGWYCNIESEIDNYLIPTEECDEFERNHTVIFHADFDRVQSEFITCAVNNSQEKAVQMILAKYK